jgi:putative ABC transport system permease protein
MFKARTARTLLTIFGMGIGIGAILFLVSFGYGLQNVLLETITTSDSLLSVDVLPNKEGEKFLDGELLDEISKMGDVEQVNPVFDLGAQVKFSEVVSDATAVVVKPEFLKLAGTKVVQGEPLTDENPRQVVITSAFAKIFNKEPDEMLGRTINFSVFVPKDGSGEETEQKDMEGDFEIGGIVKSEDATFFVNVAAVGGSENLGNYSRLKIRCKSSRDIDAVKSRLSEKGLVVSSLSETVAEVNRFFKIVNVILALFGVIALAVSAIGMFNTMTVALLERTQEIGIMKAVGASDSDIRRMFIAEASLMGFLGGVAGVILGMITGKVFNILVNILARQFGGKPVNLFSYPLWFVLLIVGLGFLVGFFTGVIPARRASAVDPLQALQYK